MYRLGDSLRGSLREVQTASRRVLRTFVATDPHRGAGGKTRRVETFGNYTARALAVAGVAKNVATSLIFNESLITSGSNAVSSGRVYADIC